MRMKWVCCKFWAEVRKEKPATTGYCHCACFIGGFSSCHTSEGINNKVYNPHEWQLGKYILHQTAQSNNFTLKLGTIGKSSTLWLWNLVSVKVSVSSWQLQRLAGSAVTVTAKERNKCNCAWTGKTQIKTKLTCTQLFGSRFFPFIL